MLAVYNGWLSWQSLPPKNPDTVCFHCGSGPETIVRTYEVNGIKVGICGTCLKSKPMKGSRANKAGCHKCDYTGYAYGNIPCMCMEDNNEKRM